MKKSIIKAIDSESSSERQINMNIQTLKGFRDFLPAEAKKRQYVINTLQTVFESYGFEPLETPALEYEEILTGKYGEEGDKLMYRFTDNGGRRVAMRYDQTVPLARVVAQYQNQLPFPFKRYQIQPVWRADNTQKGRFREFLQCDADIVGSSSPMSDTEIIAVAAKSMDKLGFEEKYTIIINDRDIFIDIGKIVREKFPNTLLDQLSLFFAITQSLDKFIKFGKEKVIEELTEKKLTNEEALFIVDIVAKKEQTDRLKKIIDKLSLLGIKDNSYVFRPTLARGLNYYTGVIFEIEVKEYVTGSVCGGGRYDNLIGMFAGRQIPAVGFAFGFDRIIEAMEEQNLFPADLPGQTTVLVTVFNLEFVDASMEVASRLREVPVGTSLRSNSINVELWLDANVKMEKQLKYADQKGIPYVVIIGPEEKEKKVVTLRNMKTREQKQVSVGQAIEQLKTP